MGMDQDLRNVAIYLIPYKHWVVVAAGDLTAFQRD